MTTADMTKNFLDGLKSGELLLRLTWEDWLSIPPPYDDRALTAGDVRLDTRSGRVTLGGEPVKLTAQEYKLLSYLMHHKGKVVSRTELIEHIYDQDFDRDSNTIEVFVTRIRKKLGADVITTIRGLGYSLDDPADAPRG